MKTFSLPCLLLLLSGCAHRHVVRVDSELHRSLPSSATESVRSAETIRAYHVGRLPDVQDQLHEAHTVYRIESGPHWNLNPSTAEQGLALATGVRPPLSDVLLVELNRQRTANTKILEQAAALKTTFVQVQHFLEEAKVMMDQNRLLAERLAAAERRLAELETRTSGEIEPKNGNPTTPKPEP